MHGRIPACPSMSVACCRVSKVTLPGLVRGGDGDGVVGGAIHCVLSKYAAAEAGKLRICHDRLTSTEIGSPEFGNEVQEVQAVKSVILTASHSGISVRHQARCPHRLELHSRAKNRECSVMQAMKLQIPRLPIYRIEVLGIPNTDYQSKTQTKWSILLVSQAEMQGVY